MGERAEVLDGAVREVVDAVNDVAALQPQVTIGRRDRRHAGATEPSHMITLASGLSYLDLNFYGVKGVIASVILHGPGGVAIIDPGPSSTLPALRAGLALREGRPSRFEQGGR